MDCLRRLAQDMERAQREGWCFGAKLVRGAYMFMERDRAKQCGYPSPVNDTIEATHANYNECAGRSMRLGCTHALAKLRRQYVQHQQLDTALRLSLPYAAQQVMLGMRPPAHMVFDPS